MNPRIQTRNVIRDNLSGSQDITAKAAEIVVQLAREGASHNPEKLRRAVLQTARAILQAQPVMASLYHLFVRVLDELDRTSSGPQAALRVKRAARTFIREIEEHNRCISEHLFKRIKKKPALVTHSASRSVRDALLGCWSRGKRFSVVCGESRPACEGAQLARVLARRGIPTTLTTDSLVSSLLAKPTAPSERAAMVLTGADAISPAGLVNKAGTLTLAVVARQCAIPIYALAGSEKMLPAAYPLHGAVTEKPRAEIIAFPPKGLRVVNRYFDVTPLSYLTGVIGEQGLIPARRLVQELKKLHARAEIVSLIQQSRRRNS